MKYSIVIPCYNEEKGIERLVTSIRKLHLPEKELEVLFVQNGSKDRTGEMLRKFTDGTPWMKIVEIPVNQGYGYGIKQGLKASAGEYVGWMHADLQIPPAELETAFAQIERADGGKRIFLKGRRTNRPFLENLFTFGMSCYETLLLGCVLYDINAQPSVFSRTLYEQWSEAAPDDFSLDLYAYYFAKKAGAQIVRWKVCQHAREAGESSWNTGMGARWKLVKRTLKFSRELKKAAAFGKR